MGSCWSFFLEVLAVVATVAVVNELANSGSQSYTVSKPLGSSYDALSTQSKKNQASKKKQQISIQSGQTTSPMPPKGPNKNYNNKYQGKTLYQDKNVHVDYEYNGNGTGNVHLQEKRTGGKFYYDAVNNVLRTGQSISSPLAPPSIQNYLNTPKIFVALEKGTSIINSLGGIG